MSYDVTKIKTIPALVTFGTLAMGLTEGPIEFSVEGLNKEIKADQFADEVLALINQGSNISIKATFKEVTVEMVKEIYAQAGLASPFADGSCSDSQYTDQATCELNAGTWTPNATEVIGFGSAKVGTNLSTTAKAIKLEPMADAQKNMSAIFWKAYPVPGGINYSGAEEATLEIEFKVIEDTTKPKAISKGYIGNPSDMPNYAA